MFGASTNKEGFGALQSWWMMNQKCPCGTLVQNTYWQAASFYNIEHEQYYSHGQLKLSCCLVSSAITSGKWEASLWIFSGELEY